MNRTNTSTDTFLTIDASIASTPSRTWNPQQRWANKEMAALLLEGVNDKTWRRLSGCGVARIDRWMPVALYTSSNGRAYFGNLQRCSYGRLCPVCAPRITHNRAKEVEKLGRAVEERGGIIYTVVLTVQHTPQDVLAVMLQKIRAAVKALGSGRNALSKSVPGWLGACRHLGVTHSEWGWNPHWHCLFFLDKPWDGLPDLVQKRWLEVCAAVGLIAGKSGVFVELVEDVGKAAWYLQQHDESEEEQGKSLTPWQLLERSASGEAEATALWREYAVALHGQRVFEGASTLRKRLGLSKEKTDAQLNATRPVQGEPTQIFDEWAWRDIAMNRQQANVLATFTRKAGFAQQK